MKCVICGGNMEVIDSRQHKEYRYRRHSCKCGERLSTSEIAVNRYKELVNSETELFETKRALKFLTKNLGK